ncbi:MAG: NAD(P)H-dependent oxidoreductase [Lactobacillales bacterium]|nr:NAD(P)H-dependent oxidoreductase [Lactobacillales bacterium]
MSKVLVVKGHPLTSEESFSVKGLDKFVEIYEANHPNDEVELLDVFHDNVPEIDADIASAFIELGKGTDFTALSEDQQAKVARYSQLTEQFLNADKVVVANPLWNGQIPTRLKAWFDTINVAGKTFRYTENGPVGLTEGKKVLHIQANGGVYSGSDSAAKFVDEAFKFIGVDDVQAVFIEGHAYAPDKAEEILSDSLAKIEEIAKEF